MWLRRFAASCSRPAARVTPRSYRCSHTPGRGRRRRSPWRHIRDRTLLIEQKNVDGEIHAGQKTGRAPRTVDLLSPLRADLIEWRLALGSRRRGFMFPNREGDPWREHDWLNWNRRIWTPAAQKAGVSEPPYTLRHSYASLRIREGASIPELAEELGHSPQMTLNTYGHVIRELRGARVASAEAQVLTARKRAGRAA